MKITIEFIESTHRKLSEMTDRIDRLADEASEGECTPEFATDKLISIMDDLETFAAETKAELKP